LTIHIFIVSILNFILFNAMCGVEVLETNVRTC
jgi:hypothetical protein